MYAIARGKKLNVAPGRGRGGVCALQVSALWSGVLVSIHNRSLLQSFLYGFCQGAGYFLQWQGVHNHNSKVSAERESTVHMHGNMYPL